MFFKTFTAVLALVGAVMSHPSAKRDEIDTDDIKIYAYGSGISGLQVYGGTDGRHPLSLSHLRPILSSTEPFLVTNAMTICTYRQGVHSL